MEPDTFTIIWQLALLIALVGVSAFCSSAEMALFSLSRPKVLSYKDSPSAVRRLIWKLMNSQSRTLITIIFCNMFVNSMISMVNETLLQKLNLPPAATLAASAFTGIVILLLLGEVTPMTIAYVFSDRWAECAARPVYYASRLLAPLTSLVEHACNRVLDLLGHAKVSGLKPQEYLSFIDNGVERGSFTPEEAKLMKETIALRRKTVESVMRTRSELYFITDGDTPETIRKIIREHALPYLPVSSDKRLDNADAILSARLFFALPPEARANWRKSACVQDHALFIPEQTTLEKALRTLKRSKTYAALAADEYGAVSGIITREDIYSELAGRSVELNEQTDYDVVKLGPGRWMFDGMATLDFMKSTLALKIESGRFSATTLNGIFCELLGSIPQQGDKVTFGPVTMTAHAMSGNRISRMLVTLLPAEAAEDNAGGGEKR